MFSLKSTEKNGGILSQTRALGSNPVLQLPRAGATRPAQAARIRTETRSSVCLFFCLSTLRQNITNCSTTDVARNRQVAFASLSTGLDTAPSNSKCVYHWLWINIIHYLEENNKCAPYHVAIEVSYKNDTFFSPSPKYSHLWHASQHTKVQKGNQRVFLCCVTASRRAKRTHQRPVGSE